MRAAIILFALLITGCDIPDYFRQSTFGLVCDEESPCEGDTECIEGICRLPGDAVIDAGIDAGPPDSGPVDAGNGVSVDAGPLDAGTIDAGTFDAGPADAGI